MKESEDVFIRFLARKAHDTFSTLEIQEIFRRRYGDGDKTAMANVIMMILRDYTKKPNKTDKDKEYEKKWNDALNQYYR